MRLQDGLPCFLSDTFYEKHPRTHYPEIEMKRDRPHVMFLIESDDGTWFAIPLRSNIRHKFCFKTVNHGGLDYSKAIPVLDPSFIDHERKALVRKSDWPIIQSNRARIKQGMSNYLERYRMARKKPDNPGNALLIRYSTLQYFETELGLNT